MKNNQFKQRTATQIHEELGVTEAMFRKRVQGGNWDELANGLEPSTRDQIINFTQLVASTQDAVNLAGLNDIDFQASTSGVLANLHRYADELVNIIDTRAGRSGPTRNEDEYTEYMALGLRLTTLSEEMCQVVGHAIMVLQARHDMALKVLEARAAAEKKAEEQAAAVPAVGVDIDSSEHWAEVPSDKPIWIEAKDGEFIDVEVTSTNFAGAIQVPVGAELADGVAQQAA